MRAAVQVAAGNRRTDARARAEVRAVVRGDVTLHSHVRLLTRGAVLAFGTQQGDHEPMIERAIRVCPTWG
jgi:hypothetical protein